MTAKTSSKQRVWVLTFLSAGAVVFADPPGHLAPGPQEQQLPRSMRSAMAEGPVMHVGQADGDLTGSDNRVLQAAVDYVAALGGGTVVIGPGVYTMHDSLHLRSRVTVRGTRNRTLLKKADGIASPLVLDGDFGEEQITLQTPAGFTVGGGVAIWDDNAGGFHTTVARITGRRDNTFSISRPLMADCMVRNHAQAATVFPVVSGYDLEGACVEDLTIDGNRHANMHLNGCRGAGIFLYRGFGTLIQRCTVQHFNGDGISFQQSNDVTVLDCVSEGNAALGIHPGSGSQRPTVRGCVARNNDADGLFLCWRVRHGLFEGNTLEQNGRFGISIGHKDSDNLLQHNTVRGNAKDGIFFRNESEGMAAHRNRIIENTIENNGRAEPSAGIRVRGHTNHLTFAGNIIRDTRQGDARTQSIGVLLEENVGPVTLADNSIEAETPVVDKRAVSQKKEGPQD